MFLDFNEFSLKIIPLGIVVPLKIPLKRPMNTSNEEVIDDDIIYEKGENHSEWFGISCIGNIKDFGNRHCRVCCESLP